MLKTPQQKWSILAQLLDAGQCNLNGSIFEKLISHQAIEHTAIATRLVLLREYLMKYYYPLWPASSTDCLTGVHKRLM